MAYIEDTINSCSSRFVFDVKPEEFPDKMEEFRNRVKNAGQDDKYIILRELKEITIDLQSYLPRLNLQNKNNSYQVFDESIKEEIEKNKAVIKKLKPEDMFYINLAAEHISESNLYRMTRMYDEGKVSNRWGHNKASGLKDALRRGASLVTTNPMLINLARKDHPEYWNMKKRTPYAIRNKIESIDDFAASMAAEIVLENARLLRPVYLANNGKMGYVSYQLNPNKSNDAVAMKKQADMAWEWMKEGFRGEEPNIVFKVPGTYAGLDVAKYLTEKGIGINVTVNYTVPQQIAFGDIIEKGNAKFCYLTQMCRRLDDAVAEEIGEGMADNPEKVSTWASTAVIRRAYDELYIKKGYGKSILLAASISKPWHVERNIAKGYPIHMTISPEPIESFDKELGSFEPVASQPIPRDKLEHLLANSEIFRQAYEFERLKPSCFDNYEPTKTTLNGFSKNYNEFAEWCNE